MTAGPARRRRAILVLISLERTPAAPAFEYSRLLLFHPTFADNVGDDRAIKCLVNDAKAGSRREAPRLIFENLSFRRVPGWTINA